MVPPAIVGANPATGDRGDNTIDFGRLKGKVFEVRRQPQGKYKMAEKPANTQVFFIAWNL